VSDFKVSTEITTKDSSSGAIRKATKGLKSYRSAFRSFAVAELRRGGIDAGKTWDRIKAGAASTATSMTSVGGAARAAFGLSKAAATGFFSVAKLGLFGSAGLLTGLGLAAHAIHGLVDEFVQAGDEVSASATKLGIGVGALQELRYAADFSDLSMEEFDAGVAKLNQNLGKAKLHTGALYSELRKSRDGKALLAQLLGTQSPDEAVGVIVEAARRIPDVTRRAAFMRTALGGAGTAWLKFGDLGAAGLQRLREEARASGSVLTEAQTQLAGEVDDANKRLGYSWAGLKRQIATDLAPAVLEFTQSITSYLNENRAGLAERISGAIKTAATALHDAYTATRKWLDEGGWESIKSSAVTVWETVGKIGSAISAATDAIGGLKGAFELLTAGAVIGSLTRLAAAVAGIAAARAGAAAVAQAEALNAIGLPVNVAAAESSAKAAATAGLGWFGPLAAAAYAGAKGIEYTANQLGPQDTATGVDERGRQLYTRSGGALDTLVGSLGALTGRPAPQSSREIARQYVAREMSKGDSGIRLYNQLQDRGASLDQLRALNDAIRTSRATSPFDIAGRVRANDRIEEIVVRFDGLPGGARPEVQGKSGGAKVSADLGRRGFGGVFGNAGATR